MTESSRMVATSFMVGVQSGRAGSKENWLLEEIHKADCRLGEMSIWEEDNTIM